MQLATGTRVGSFTILARLGVGGMGALYRARDERLRREVAIKILQEKLADSPENLRRFEREARSASALNHPNIVTIFDVGEFAGAPFIAMELIDGESLRDLLKRGPLPVRKLLDIFGQFADGLAAAHERGIVHRDLKPDNVMVTTESLVKILDFGVARMLKPAFSDETTADLTVDTPNGQIVGTAAYMSPEQASGRTVDFRSDQFSFGSTLYELATGRRAFRRDSAAETLVAIIHDEPEPAQRLNPRLPPGVCSVIGRCLAKDPKDRYASTRDLARELQSLRENASVSVSAKAIAPRIATVGAVAAVIVIIGAGILVNKRMSRLNAQPLPAQKFVAVLPFKDLSGRPDGRLFSEGFADAVSARLARNRGIQVIPPASAAPLVSKDASFSRIAQELGATLVLRASVQRSGDDLRVSYTLVDPARGTEIAGDAVNGSVRNLFATEDEVADGIAGDLGVAQPPSRTSPAGLETPEEQNLYVRALGNLDHVDDEKAIDAAIASLRELTETAANSPLVQRALGRAYLAKYNITHDRQWGERAIRACTRAQELEPNSPDSLFTTAEVLRITGQYDAAVNEYRRALAAKPDSPEAAIGLGRAYQGTKHFDEADAAFRHGISLRPTWWYGYNYLGILDLSRGLYDRAAQQFQAVIRLNPQSSWGYINAGNVSLIKGRLDEASTLYNKAISLQQDADAYSNLGYCYYFLGQYDKAAASARKATTLRPSIAAYWVSLADACRWSSSCRDEVTPSYSRAVTLLRNELAVNPNNSRALASLAVCLARTGHVSESRKLIQRALQLDPQNPTRMYQAGLVANASGDEAGALNWLKRAIDAGYQRFEIDRDPEFATLRQTKRFHEEFKALPTAKTTA